MAGDRAETIEQIQRAVAALVATQPAGVGLWLVGGFRYRLLDRAVRRSVDIEGKPLMVQTLGRHDPCVGIRATPIAEALLAIILADHALRHRAQCGEPVKRV